MVLQQDCPLRLANFVGFGGAPVYNAPIGFWGIG
jgi:hypothetical protein